MKYKSSVWTKITFVATALLMAIGAVVGNDVIIGTCAVIFTVLSAQQEILEAIHNEQS